MWRLLSNKVYIVSNLGICCEICIVSGFVVFLPKYLETQFGVSKSTANLMTGKVVYLEKSTFFCWNIKKVFTSQILGILPGLSSTLLPCASHKTKLTWLPTLCGMYEWSLYGIFSHNFFFNLPLYPHSTAWK